MSSVLRTITVQAPDSDSESSSMQNDLESLVEAGCESCRKVVLDFHRLKRLATRR